MNGPPCVGSRWPGERLCKSLGKISGRIQALVGLTFLNDDSESCMEGRPRAQGGKTESSPVRMLLQGSREAMRMEKRGHVQGMCARRASETDG